MKTYHVQLNAENTEKMIRASNDLGRSVSDVVNAIVGAVEKIDVKEIVSLKPEPTENGTRPSKVTLRKTSTWRIRP